MAAIKKTSSRVARLQAEQERRLIIRITLFAALGFSILLALVFWGVPAFVGISNFWLNSKMTSTEALVKPAIQDVLVPTLGQFTDDLTNQDNIDVTGYASEGKSLVLERNGVQVGENVADGSGTVSFGKMNLNEGKNEFRAYIVTKDGMRSDSSNAVSIVRDTQPPTIAVNSPFSGQAYKGVSQQVIEVSGKANDAKYVFVSETRVIVGSDGNFSQRIKLSNGENAIEIYAVDEAGNQSVKDTRTVRWEE